jgi:hypothetical protein
MYTYTVQAVTAVVTMVAAATNNAPISGLAPLVAFIIADQTPRVWYTQHWYMKWRKWPALWEPVAERAFTHHYSDSRRTNDYFIGSTTSEHWFE